MTEIFLKRSIDELPEERGSYRAVDSFGHGCILFFDGTHWNKPADYEVKYWELETTLENLLAQRPELVEKYIKRIAELEKVINRFKELVKELPDIYRREGFKAAAKKFENLSEYDLQEITNDYINSLKTENK